MKTFNDYVQNKQINEAYELSSIDILQRLSNTGAIIEELMNIILINAGVLDETKRINIMNDDNIFKLVSKNNKKLNDTKALIDKDSDLYKKYIGSGSGTEFIYNYVKSNKYQKY